MCVNLLRNSVINQFVYLQTKHYALKLIGKLPANKRNEVNYLRNNMIKLLLCLQIKHYARKLTEKLPVDKYFFLPGVTQSIVYVYFTALYLALASSRTRLLDDTQRRATVGRTPLNEWSVRRRDLYLKTHNTHNRQTSMPRVGFEPTIAAG